MTPSYDHSCPRFAIIYQSASVTGQAFHKLGPRPFHDGPRLDALPLDLSYTAVADLTPFQAHTALQTLHCAWTPVAKISESLVRLPTLQTLILHETALSNVPVNALTPDSITNCIEPLRAYLNQ